MTTGILHDQNLEKHIDKQMGCMAGFLQLFERHQILAGKSLNATKRLPPSPTVTDDSKSKSEKSAGSPAFSRELQPQTQQQQQQQLPKKASPSLGIRSPVPGIEIPAEILAKMPLPLPVFEFKEGLRSSWKLKESPRLSLDSRAIVDGKGSLYPREIRTNTAISSATAEDNDNQRRSPSVIARLMGLEALPDSGREPITRAELRRSASESRVSRDTFQYQFIDGNNFQLKQPHQSNSGSNILSKNVRDNAVAEDRRSKNRTSMEFRVRKPKSEQPKASNRCLASSPWNSQQQRKSFFDSQDFFPEPKQTGYLYGEIEKRLKMRGIDEPAKDVETLKQILEALQFKGLLHSKKPAEQIDLRDFVIDRRFSEESPIVVMKPSRSTVSINRIGRTGSESPPNFPSKAGIRRNLNLAVETLPPVRPRRERPDIDRNLQKETRARNSSSPDRSESTARSPSSLARRRPLNIETQKRGNDSVEQRRSSPIHSPKISSKKTVSDQTISRSPRNRKPTAEIARKDRISCPAEEESSSISESSISTSSQIDTERSRMENYNDGRSLLERCDKLLHSIAEITVTSPELQPSPVSVLDSSFYKDESSPSPVMKRCIDFEDQSVELELEDDNWSPVILPHEGKSDDCDFLYISEILGASNCLSEELDVFLLLEKQRYKANTSKVSRLHRRLIFDTITEIVDRKRQLTPWKVFPGTNFVLAKPFMQQVWSEFRRTREMDFGANCEVLRKDMAGEMEMAVLYIERLIFKDLICEAIRDLADFAGKNGATAPRRKLVF